MKEYLPQSLINKFTRVAQSFNPNIIKFRGGTDGSALSQRGLPTPNVWDGAGNFHSVTEYVIVREALEAV